MRPLFALIVFSCFISKIFSQGCPQNIDFENGDFSNWQCFIGTTYESSGTNVIDLKPSPPTSGRHQIISAAADGTIPLDYYGGFPQLCPYGGKYSVMLGNSNTGAEAEGISYTFTVPATEDTFSFTYFYAVVFEDPAHSLPEQPRFFVTAYEVQTGELINCASYNYVSTGGIPGFKQSKLDAGVLYKEWSPSSIQFVGLANKKVRLEFKTADCTLGGHFGYAYLDVGSGCSNILATAPYCIETNSLLLNAPYGFQYYTWYNEDYSQVMGHDQNLTLSPPPRNAGKFYVDLEPYPGYGCRDTAYALVTPLPVPDTPVAEVNYFYCQNAAANPLSAQPSINCDVYWYTDTTLAGTRDAPVPSTAQPGTFVYYVSQKVLFGCESFKKKITVRVDPVPVTSFIISNPVQCQDGNIFTFTNTSSNLLNSSYEWDLGDGKTIKDSTAIHYQYSGFGNFNVGLKVTNGPVCFNQAFNNIKVSPQPVADYSYPPVLCEKQTLLTFTDQSYVPQNLSSVVKWHWVINNNAEDTQTPQSFVTTTPGGLPVSLVVESGDGCVADTNMQVLAVRHRPQALYKLDEPLCDNKFIHFTDASVLPVEATGENINQWQWNINNTNAASSRNFISSLPTAVHHISLMVTTNFGCESLVIDSLKEVFPQPDASVSINDSCVYRDIFYQANDGANNVANWYWDFGKGAESGSSVQKKYFSKEGNNTFTLYAQTIHGCRDTVNRPFRIYDNKAFARQDTTAAFGQPVQLVSNGGTDNFYNWSPATGLNDAHVENPIATLSTDVLYRLDAVNNEGCDAHSKVLVKRMKGPDIYIPTGFTPNNDRLNDVLFAVPVGMRKLEYFAIYNRYGEQVYYTNDFTKGWNGNHKGLPAPAGTYIAVAYATDYTGKAFKKTGTVVLIK